MARGILSIVATSELVGGILAIVGWVLIAATHDVQPAWSILPAFGFGLLAMLSGILLFRQHHWGVPLSIAVQVLQILSISSVGQYRYVALAGPFSQLILASNGVRLNIGAGGAFVGVPWCQDGSLEAPGVSVDVDGGVMPGSLADSGFTVAINFVALYFLWRLLDFVGGQANAPAQHSLDESATDAAL